MAAWTDAVPVVETLSLEAVRELLDQPPPPCLSLYLPTHRTVPDNAVDRPAFMHLVESLEVALEAGHPREAIERLLRPFRRIAADVDLWRHTRDGLAVLAAGGGCRVFLLERLVAPLAMTGRRFHLMPLVRAVTGLERFDVLALTTRSARVYAGRIWHDPRGAGGERLDPVRLAPLPGGEPVEALTRPDVITPELVQPHRVKHGLGPAGRGATAFVHGGYGTKQDDIDRDTEIFLRHVDDIVHEQVTRHSDVPLVLVARGRLAASFRGLAHNPLVHDEHVDLDPHLLSVDELLAAIVPVFVRGRAALIARHVRGFVQARDRGHGSGDLADVARAAVAGQVATLLVEADRFETGRLDRSSGALGFEGSPPGDLSRTGDEPAVIGEDVYAAVAETVLAKGGSVVTLARNEMPTESGVAAIYRYA